MAIRPRIASASQRRVALYSGAEPVEMPAQSANLVASLVWSVRTRVASAQVISLARQLTPLKRSQAASIVAFTRGADWYSSNRWSSSPARDFHSPAVD